MQTIIWVLVSSTSGGNLAPILIIGGSLCGTVGELLHVPHPGVWALLGISVIFSGVTPTPLQVSSSRWTYTQSKRFVTSTNFIEHCNRIVLFHSPALDTQTL
ncbi:chloride channel protein [Alicyclobacillus tolerans]|nr:chloride channel protein [Alicyclobacillus tolerans]